MARLTTSTARKAFAEVVGRAAYGKQRTVIHRHGRDAAAIVPMEDLALIERIEDELDIKGANKAVKDGGKILTLDELKKKLGL